MTDRLHLPESIYEDWIAANIEQVVGEGATVLARQLRLPSGRVPDLIVAIDRQIVVLEVKARPASAKAVAQVLGYAGEIEHETARVILTHPCLAAPGLTETGRFALLAAGMTFFEVRPTMTSKRVTRPKTREFIDDTTLIDMIWDRDQLWAAEIAEQNENAIAASIEEFERRTDTEQ